MAVQVGLVGYGLAGKVFHAPLFPAAGLELAAVASSDRSKVLADHPNARVYSTPNELFADTDIDLIVLASPTPTHAPLMMEALAAGKHVVADKPFTATSAQADEVIAKAERVGRMVTCFQNRRWDSDFLTLRKLIDSGELGQITSYRAHFDGYKPAVRDRWQERAAPGVGIHFELGAHLVDQALQLFGLPDWIEGDVFTQRPNQVADEAIYDCFHVRMGKGMARIDLFASFLIPDYDIRYAVHGTKGSYIKSHMDIQESQLRAGMTPLSPGYGIESAERHARVTTYADGARQTRHEPSVPGAHHRFYELLRQAIEAWPNSQPPVLAREARDTIRVIEAIVESSKAGQRVRL